MLKRVRITDPGDSEFLLGEHVEKPIFERSTKAFREGQRPAAAEPLLLASPRRPEPHEVVILLRPCRVREDLVVSWNDAAYITLVLRDAW